MGLVNRIQNGSKNSCGLCTTSIEGLGVTRGNYIILENVNVHMRCGELTAIIGPNGAGKSTLLKALLGEIKHTGQLKFLNNHGKETNKPNIGYVPQQLSFDLGMPTSVYDLFVACKSERPVWLSHSKKLRVDILKILSRVQAEQVIDRRLGALSGGELQRVLLALALDPMPDILLLDEPVSGVDRSGMELFYEMVSTLRKDFDLTILLISHDLPLIARYADRVVFLNNKTVGCIGTPLEVFGNRQVLDTFGIITPSSFNKEGSETI